MRDGDNSGPWTNDLGTFYKTGNGFVSYSRTGTGCVASMIVGFTKFLVEHHETEELLEDLPADFRPDGRSCRMLKPDGLESLGWTLGSFERAIRVSDEQALELAQLGVALINYDMRHLDDDTHTLLSVQDRDDIEKMIALVEPKLMDKLMPLDFFRFNAKQLREAEASRLRIEEYFRSS